MNQVGMLTANLLAALDGNSPAYVAVKFGLCPRPDLLAIGRCGYLGSTVLYDLVPVLRPLRTIVKRVAVLGRPSRVSFASAERG